MDKLFLLIVALIPFQFALNPTSSIDLAILRIIIPLFFLCILFNGLVKRSIILPLNKSAVFLYSFLFCTIFSLLFSQNLVWSIRKLIFLLSIFPIFPITYYLLSKKRAIGLKIIKVLVFSTLSLSLISIFQFLLQFSVGIDNTTSFWSKIITPFIGNNLANSVLNYNSWYVNIGGLTLMRATGIFPDPHMLSFFLTLIFPFSIAFAYEKSNLKYFIFPLLILITNILTFSRSAYIALIVGIVVFLFFKKPSKVVYIVILAILVSFFSVSSIRMRLISSLDQTDNSNIGRLQMWKEAATVIAHKPLGLGLGGFPLEVRPSASYREPIYAHNQYLDIATEIGIQGLLFWILTLASAAFSFYKLKNNIYSLAGLFSILLFSIQSLFDSALFSVQNFAILLIIIALSCKTDAFKETFN